MRAYLPVVFSLVALAATAASSLCQGQARAWNFDDLPVGAPGSPFLAGSGEWRIQPHPLASSKPNVLAQSAKSERAIFNVLLVRGSDYKDLDLSVRLLAVAGEVDQGGGVVWRARDAQNYYIARYNPLENNFRVYKVVNGSRTQLQSADIQAGAGWHTMRVTTRGDAMECYLNGQRLLRASDTAFSGSGKIGVWTKADAQTLFDDLTVSPVKTN